MRLISLNVWTGRLIDPLLSYIAAQAPTTDIFCFQEVTDGPQGMGDLGDGFRADTYRRLKDLLVEFHPHYAPAEEGADDFAKKIVAPVNFGQATFVRNNLEVVEEGKLWISDMPEGGVKNRFERPRIMQYLHILTPDGMLTVGNLHGLLDGGSKGDTPDRYEQFKRTAAFFDAIPHAKLLCGDFNTRPEAESLTLLEGNMENLIRTHHITATRNHLYPGMAEFQDDVSDYMFVSPGVKVQKFEVDASVTVSDHLPLSVDFIL